jgi:hypothetical protein
MQRIKEHLVQANSLQIDQFFTALDARLGRSIHRVLIVPLYGRVNEFLSVGEALEFLELHPIYEGSGEFGSMKSLSNFRMGIRLTLSLATNRKFAIF